MSWKMFNCDCRDAMGFLIAENSIDSIVTDPPYGLGFMGKEWDHGVPGVEFWQRAYEVLKPGGHLLAFSGSRTYHRMVCAIEDAGFEIRDQIMWVYGSGFPKSLDVSKAIDKSAGAVRAGTGETTRAGCRAARGGNELVGSESVEAAKWKEITIPATQASQQWQGWGTALKPAHEPICVARKPLEKGNTVAANVLHWGTGALNIDACRVESSGGCKTATPYVGGDSKNAFGLGLNDQRNLPIEGLERWPANLIHDGSDEVLAGFPQTQAAKAGKKQTPAISTNAFGDYAGRDDIVGHTDNGSSAARFFYCPKASKKDRNEGITEFATKQQDQSRKLGDPGGDNPRNGGLTERANHHPTVKPTELMAYLCRLVTPPGGTALDPFAGSGSTGKAAVREGFNFVGCELDADYVAIAEARIAAEFMKAKQ